MLSIWISMFLHLWFDDAHVDSMEYGLMSTWRDAHGVMFMVWWCSCWFNGIWLVVYVERCSWYYVIIYLSFCGICIASHSFIHWHMELCRCLLAVTVPVQHCLLGITMRLHTLLGMKAGDTAFALHMHYNFGVWHDSLGLRLWMSLWEAMLLQGLVIINSFHVWGCVNCWIYLIAYCWFTYNWGLNRS